ncbi:MAG: hypothetical protein AB8B91_16065 [Rubripirellula sp.]
MNEQAFRTIGALTGLAVGIAIMSVMGMRGIMLSALFGAAGCVAGSVIAEQIHRSLNRDR